MRKPHWAALAVMIVGIVSPAWGQEAQGSFFHRPSPVPAAPPPGASLPPPAVEASPIPALQPTPPTPGPPAVVRMVPPVTVPAAPTQTETEPVIDRCGSNPDSVLQFLRVFFANGSGSTRAVLAYQELIYADQLAYYGKVTPRAAVLRQKEAYLNRWPLRTYTMRDNGEIRCNEATSTYDFAGVVDWTASSPAINTGAVRSGAAVVRLGISAFSLSSFKITRESSQVIGRHSSQ